jgi:hypothetical protein
MPRRNIEQERRELAADGWRELAHTDACTLRRWLHSHIKRVAITLQLDSYLEIFFGMQRGTRRHRRAICRVHEYYNGRIGLEWDWINWQPPTGELAHMFAIFFSFLSLHLST